MYNYAVVPDTIVAPSLLLHSELLCSIVCRKITWLEYHQCSHGNAYYKSVCINLLTINGTNSHVCHYIVVS